MNEILVTFLMVALMVQFPLLPCLGLGGLFILNENYNNDNITKEQAEEETIKEIFLTWLSVTFGAAILFTAVKFFI